MNPVTRLSAIIEAVVFSDDALLQALDPDQPAWLDVGAPLSGPDANATWPCVRIDGLVAVTGKAQLYSANVKLWSQDMSACFFDLVERLRVGLQGSDQVLCEQYLHRPETGLNCALFPVQFYC